MENINLIRKIAWKFEEKQNEIPFDDLFQEAALAYCEAVEKFDPHSGVKLTTYAYQCMYNHLTFVCTRQTYVDRETGKTVYARKEQAQIYDELPANDHPRQEVKDSFDDFVAELPDDCRQVINMILDNPEFYLGETPYYKRKGGPKGRIQQKLRSEQWIWSRIHGTIKQLTQIIKSN